VYEPPLILLKYM